MHASVQSIARARLSMGARPQALCFPRRLSATDPPAQFCLVRVRQHRRPGCFNNAGPVYGDHASSIREHVLNNRLAAPVRPFRHLSVEQVWDSSARYPCRTSIYDADHQVRRPGARAPSSVRRGNQHGRDGGVTKPFNGCLPRARASTVTFRDVSMRFSRWYDILGHRPAAPGHYRDPQDTSSSRSTDAVTSRSLARHSPLCASILMQPSAICYGLHGVGGVSPPGFHEDPPAPHLDDSTATG